MRLPELFVRNISSAFPERGAPWLASLPDLIAGYAARWQLTLGEPYPLSYNYVVAATRDGGQRVVLKLGPPPVPGQDPSDYGHEFPALRAAAGRGLVRLLEYDAAGGGALLERIEPGTPLTELVLAGNDEQATAVALEVMRALREVAPGGHPFPELVRWARAYEQPCPAGIPPADFDRGAGLFADLLADSVPAVLLHGDLHHDNILRRPGSSGGVGGARGPAGEWVAIDPKGVLGEPAFEVAALLRNPYPQVLTMPDPARLLARRVDQLAEGLAVPAQRVRAWGYAAAVLSAVWDADVGLDPSFALGCALHLR